MVQYFNNFSISGHAVAKTDTIEYPVLATLGQKWKLYQNIVLFSATMLFKRFYSPWSSV